MAAVMAMAAMTAVMTVMALMKMKMRMTAVEMLVVESGDAGGGESK
jgi:hypothetical protein